MRHHSQSLKNLSSQNWTDLSKNVLKITSISCHCSERYTKNILKHKKTIKIEKIEKPR